jgi:hypothetical protein
MQIKMREIRLGYPTTTKFDPKNASKHDQASQLADEHSYLVFMISWVQIPAWKPAILTGSFALLRYSRQLLVLYIS